MSLNLCVCIWDITTKMRLVADPDCKARHYGTIVTYRLK